jgi:hypothetical protein
MKPCLKGFHLLLETWRGGRDKEGWKARAQEGPREEDDPGHSNMEDIKRSLLTEVTTGRSDQGTGPPGGFTLAMPHFREDIEALVRSLRVSGHQRDVSEANGCSRYTMDSAMPRRQALEQW